MSKLEAFHNLGACNETHDAKREFATTKLPPLGYSKPLSIPQGIADSSLSPSTTPPSSHASVFASAPSSPFSGSFLSLSFIPKRAVTTPPSPVREHCASTPIPLIVPIPSAPPPSPTGIRRRKKRKIPECASIDYLALPPEKSAYSKNDLNKLFPPEDKKQSDGFVASASAVSSSEGESSHRRRRPSKHLEKESNLLKEVDLFSWTHNLIWFLVTQLPLAWLQ